MRTTHCPQARAGAVAACGLPCYRHTRGADGSLPIPDPRGHEEDRPSAAPEERPRLAHLLRRLMGCNGPEASFRQRRDMQVPRRGLGSPGQVGTKGRRRKPALVPPYLTASQAGPPDRGPSFHARRCGSARRRRHRSPGDPHPRTLRSSHPWPRPPPKPQNPIN